MRGKFYKLTSHTQSKIVDNTQQANKVCCLYIAKFIFYLEIKYITTLIFDYNRFYFIKLIFFFEKKAIMNFRL